MYKETSGKYIYKLLHRLQSNLWMHIGSLIKSVFGIDMLGLFDDQFRWMWTLQQYLHVIEYNFESLYKKIAIKLNQYTEVAIELWRRLQLAAENSVYIFNLELFYIF